MEIKLKPCPFCGNNVKIIYSIDLEPNGIMCLNCRCIFRWRHIRVTGKREEFGVVTDKLVAAWNRRVIDGD